MAIPDDMQPVQVILLKTEVEKIDQLLRGTPPRQKKTRSAFLANVIRGALGFPLPVSFLQETDDVCNNQIALPAEKAA